MPRRLSEHHRTLRESEVFLQDVTRAGSFRVALVYPNLYFVGMSNLGFQTVYRLFNELEDVVCERVFLPGRQELAAQIASGRPLRTVESDTPVRDFDVVAF